MTVSAPPTSRPQGSPAPRPGRRPARRRREWPGRLATVLGLLLGAAVILFPVVGTYYNNWHAAQFAQQQPGGQAAGRGGAEAAAALAAARAYNDRLDPRTLQDPWGGKDAASTPAYAEYTRLLGGEHAVMATLRIPTARAQLAILHGTSDWSLARGAGHVYGSSLPVGGPGTHAALAAHRGLPDLTAFDHLPDVRVGDQFFVDVAGETLAYQVTRTDTVLPDDVARLERRPGQDLVTLITCTPYGVNSHRLLVTGSRIPWSQADPDAAGWHGFDWSVQPWMWPRLAMAGGTLLILLWIAAGWVRDDRRRARRRAAAQAARAAAPSPRTDPPCAP